MMHNQDKNLDRSLHTTLNSRAQKSSGAQKIPEDAKLRIYAGKQVVTGIHGAGLAGQGNRGGEGLLEERKTETGAWQLTSQGLDPVQEGNQAKRNKTPADRTALCLTRTSLKDALRDYIPRITPDNEPRGGTINLAEMLKSGGRFSSLANNPPRGRPGGSGSENRDSITIQDQDPSHWKCRALDFPVGWDEEETQASGRLCGSTLILRSSFIPRFAPKVCLDLPLTRTMRGFRSRDLFDMGFLLAVFLLCFCLPPTRAIENLPVISIPENPAEGQNVTFSVENVTGSIRQFDWYRGREFGYPNGSLLLQGARQNDSGPYTVVVLIRPKGTFKGTTVLQLASSATDAPPTTPPLTTMPAKTPSMLGWIVAGVLVGILLAGALGAILVYRFVLQKAEPGTGVAMKLDPRVKKPPTSKRDDTEPIYEVMDVPVESPQMAGKPPPPVPGPLPPLAETCPNLDSNYM
ncbi:UNVERIFIED_CONTAM: hypothetical protein K2H54_031952, partial [Gekko kuhli]